jgi:DNA-binding CsgD family transcriptional regulator
MIDPAYSVDGLHRPADDPQELPRPMDPVPAPERPATTGVARLVWAELGPRQRAVAEGVLAGETNAQLSVRLDMSVHTVREHLKRMAGRLGARGRGGLIAGLVAARGRAEGERWVGADDGGVEAPGSTVRLGAAATPTTQGS